MTIQNRSGVSAIVLAAGSSTRMGTIKALVPVGGEPMLRRVLSMLGASRVEEIVVVLGHSAEVVQQTVPLGGVKVVINDAYQSGVASSIRTGLANLRVDAEAALVVLADQPFLQAQTIDFLIGQYRSKRPEIIVPVYNGFRGNPVLLDRSVFAEIASVTGDIGCRAIFGTHTRGILKLAVQDIGVLIDLDTAADVEQFRPPGSADALTSQAFESAKGETTGPQLVVIGQDPLALALVAIARLLAFNVVVVDPLIQSGEAPGASILRVLDLSRLPQSEESFVVVTSRGRFDDEAVEQALNTSAVYIALVASRKRAQEIIANLREKGVSEDQIAKLRAPAGLDIGAVTPAEIAVSIMAEAISARRRVQNNDDVRFSR
jgi:molybdenum cofactor cytidylyltransferase